MASLWTRLLLCAGMCCGFPALAEPGTVLRLSANYWEPYTGASLPGQGLAAEIVVTALARAGYGAEITFMPWSRALAAAYSQQADGVVAIWSTSQRRSRLLYSESYLNNDLFLLSMRPDPSPSTTMDSLRGKRVGVVRDYDYSDSFLLHGGYRVEPVDRVVQNLLKLALGRVDVVLEDKRIVDYTRRKHAAELRNLPPLYYSRQPLLKLPVHFGMNRDYPGADEVVARFNLQLLAMRRDGTLAAILHRFDAQNSVP